MVHKGGWKQGHQFKIFHDEIVHRGGQRYQSGMLEAGFWFAAKWEVTCENVVL